MASILFIDDDVNILQIYSAVFLGSCYTIETARTGDTAFKIMANAAPALLILDIAMPVLSGEDILRQVRADHRYDSTRIIILTAAPNRVTPDLRALVDRVILKPVTPKALHAAVFEVIPPCP
ncbi:MAG TPA: response regulator [Aggregatilineales bacterium]|nr:response regulator [Aggregatilineales bacterium]